jgi:hypothetical protein
VTTQGRWTVALVGAAGPIGSALAAWILAMSLASTDGGWAALAGVITGLIFGGPLLALITFTVCQVTLLRGQLSRPVLTWCAMAFAAALGGLLTLLILMVGSRSDGETITGIIVAIGAIIMIGWYATAAYLVQRIEPSAGQKPRQVR